jgi:hypothetical protein
MPTLEIAENTCGARSSFRSVCNHVPYLRILYVIENISTSRQPILDSELKLSYNNHFLGDAKCFYGAVYCLYIRACLHHLYEREIT